MSDLDWAVIAFVCMAPVLLAAMAVACLQLKKCRQCTEPDLEDDDSDCSSDDGRGGKHLSAWNSSGSERRPKATSFGIDDDDTPSRIEELMSSWARQQKQAGDAGNQHS